MKPAATVLVVLLAISLPMILLGCQSGGGGPLLTAIYHETAIKGEVTVGSLMVGGVPLTFPCRAWGDGKVIAQYPALPHLDFVGQGGIIIEPIVPQHAEGLRAQIAAGTIRGATLVKHGTFASWRAGTHTSRPVEAP